MTANRAEQKGGGGMEGITSQEQTLEAAVRKALNRFVLAGQAGWCYVLERREAELAAALAEAGISIAPLGQALLPTADAALLAKVIGDLSYREVVTYGDCTEEEYRRLKIIHTHLSKR